MMNLGESFYIFFISDFTKEFFRCFFFKRKITIFYHYTYESKSIASIHI